MYGILCLLGYVKELIGKKQSCAFIFKIFLKWVNKLYLDLNKIDTFKILIYLK